MDFKISKPTLSDIPQMRNLIMPEVQKGIILDRTEDEMAGAIRSYSVIRVVDSANKKNLSLRADSQNLRGNPQGFARAVARSNHPPYEKSQNLQGGLPRAINCARNDEFLDSSVALLPQNDKNSARVAESSVVSVDFYKVDCHESANADSRNDIIIAFSALHILSMNLAEVRSLIVAPDFRRKGLATLLINQLLKEARALNLKEVLSLTYQREVFEKLGFKEIAKESLPNQKIWADCIKCKKFPVCDEIALLKTL